ncbi:hypothetical protein FACS1894110_15910 [Spirochaetia bacterium]|nr:hypothetical protein FACS1894110_15910 [Spirochaetia bacterium]
MKDTIQYLNNPVDISDNFLSAQSNYFFLTELSQFNGITKTGKILCKRYRRKLRYSFNQEMLPFEEAQGWEFPPDYRNDKELSLTLSFLSDRTVRIELDADKSCAPREHRAPLMVEYPEKLLEPERAAGWSLCMENEEKISYRSSRGALTIYRNPFKIELSDSAGEKIWESCSILEKTSLLNSEPLPCCFIQKTGTMERQFAFSYSLREDEKLYGCGESFTRLNKRGQKIVLYTTDPKGVETSQMYKPIPFYLSSAGYGAFIHDSCPMTFDFGATYGGAQSLFVGNSCFDMILFLGSPKEVLSEYTGLTGRSPMLPRWSFGLWMGRITYASQEEIMTVAEKLRSYDIPCDVIHLDTGWFSQDWRCDFIFDPVRFPDPALMMKKLHDQGFHLSLWQLPYITPQNRLFNEAVSKGYAIHDPDGGLPTEDAIYDFSNPETAAWYQGMLERILDLGVDVIKADFGEAAPVHGRYYSGLSGWMEHNLYPLRYNKTVADITKKTKGYGMIWGRSAWAGSQRYPLHWGGDAESTNSGMAASLRGGLSFGLCGFSFWSHDLGGFVKTPSPDLYLRWTAFGMFCSHARCHGNPPREPWDFSEDFIREFRKLVKWRYSLMPYILAQGFESSREGYPMIRPLFFERPEDPVCWFIEDEYFFGSQLLAAPIFEDNKNCRKVYLPSGCMWLDYHSGEAYEGGRWHNIHTDHHIIILVKDGSLIPVAEDMHPDTFKLQAYRCKAETLSGTIPRGDSFETLVVPINELGKTYTLSPNGRELQGL